MGTVNPLGKNLEEYWDGLIEGRSAGRMAEGYPTEKLTTKFACEVPNFDPQDFMDRKQAQRMARFSPVAVAASTLALADARPEHGVGVGRDGVPSSRAQHHGHYRVRGLHAPARRRVANHSARRRGR